MNKRRKLKPIKFRPELFWDVDVKTLDPKKHARYIIERILDFGNDNEVRWAWHQYQKPVIKDIVLNSRVLHDKSRSLWQLVV
jgi:hypothetical protein